MITIYANLKTGERRVMEESHSDDLPFTVFVPFLLPDILEKLRQQKTAPAENLAPHK